MIIIIFADGHLTWPTHYGHFIWKNVPLWIIFGNWVYTCHCTIVFLTSLKIKAGSRYQVIATRHPVPKTGNAANHYYCDFSYRKFESRICYRLCSLMYRVNHNTAPSYLSKLCVPCSDTHLRSTTLGNYMIPRTHRHLANRAFAVAAPSFWNSLPDNVRDFQSYSSFYLNLKLTTLTCIL